MNEEEWREVPSWEGYYEVSSLGRVRRVDAIGKRNPVYAGMGGRPLKLRFLNAYLSCDFRMPSRKQRIRVHVLVLEVFVGPRPPGMVACHRNGDKLDNRLQNLRWDTPKGNSIDNRFNGTHQHGEKCAKARLTEDQAREILHSKEKHRELAAKYGVCKATISHIKNGRNWPYLQKSITDGYTPR